MRLLFILLALFVGQSAYCDNSQLRSEASEIVETFVNEQRHAMERAIQAGPSNAIKVCSDRAPAIAQELSESSGWTVQRVSLKPRNPATGKPDGWSRRILEDFEARNSQGEDPATLVHAETVDNEYRFIKAIPVESTCLLCHGTTIAPDVQSKLDKLYPNDRATGYSMGDLRGAFYLTKPVADKDADRHPMTSASP